MEHPDLEELLRRAPEAPAGSAGAVAVAIGGRIEAATWGHTDPTSPRRATPDTLFQIGSTTKLHNAVLLLTLVDEGQVDLDAPVADTIDDLDLGHPEATKGVTLRHLLSMTAGLDNGPYLDTGDGPDAVGNYVRSLANVPPMARPGRLYGYSNAGTNVAGRLAELVLDQTWDEALRERVLEPLGLGATSTAPNLGRDDVAVAMRVDGDGLVPAVSPGSVRGMGPAGATLCSSAVDLVRLADVWLDPARSVLSASVAEQSLEEQVAVPTRCVADGWALGPCLRHVDGHLVHGHTGSNIGGSSALWWSVEHRAAVGVVVNLTAAASPIADHVLGEVLGCDAAVDLGRPLESPPPAVTLAELIGSYAATDASRRVQERDGNLELVFDRADSPLLPGLTGATTSTLSWLGGPERLQKLRFAVTGGTMVGARAWDVAFLGEEPDGPVTHLLDGIMLARRESP